MANFTKVDSVEINWVIVFVFPWDLDETNVDEVFQHIHEDLGDFKNKKVVFNFELLKYLNSKSLWYIAQTCSIIDEEWWKMYISNCDDEVREILDLVWIDYILSFAKNQDEAIKLLNNN
jgi:anti-anti-sigma regulatory factor